jgi:hypothetical protein
MPDAFLHERSDFKALVETVADREKINDPALVEKDYWIMHAVFGLKQLGKTQEGVQGFEDVVNRAVIQVAVMFSKKLHVPQKLSAVNLV